MRHSITRPVWMMAMLLTMLAAMLFAACRPVNTPPAALPMLPDAAADWQAMLKDGKLDVGNAVDHPRVE